MNPNTTSIEDTAAVGRLREELDAAREEEGCSMDALTVLAKQNDPYRLDTPAGHRDGAWLAMQAKRLGLGERTIHLRGLHYQLVGSCLKPDDTKYVNSDDDWLWMSEKAAKAARWLGYIPFEQIVDHRNAAPVIRPFEREDLAPFVTAEVEVEIPDATDLEPRVGIEGFEGVQPFKLVIFGEKSSLDEVLGPIAESHEADLYLPTGEISDTLMHRMAAEAANHPDDRRMVVLCFSDSDPSGWQMPVSIARKLQALRDLEFPGLAFEVRRVALKPDQVREYGLPSTPMKAGERRADAWEQAMGTRQTEIDSFIALHPGALRQIALDALAPFFDSTLRRRVGEARDKWGMAAQAALDEQIDQDGLDILREDAAEKLAGLKDEIEAINEAMHMEIGDNFDLPEAVVPGPEIDVEPDGEPLIDSDDSFAEQTLRLKRSKAYLNGDGE